MKKTLLIVCMSLVLVASVAVAAWAAPGISQACKAIGDLGLTHGACVSLFQSGNVGAACSASCKTDEGRAFFGGENQGECVNNCKAFFD